MLALLLAAAFCTGCSKDEPDKSSLLEKVKKIDSAMEKKYPKTRFKEPQREEHMAALEKCSEKFGACLEKCADAEKGHDGCENRCKELLSGCEKDLPDHLKTIK